MKLLQINSTLNWGSTGRIAEEIGQVVLNKGWESYIAYGRQCNKSKSQSFRIGDDWAVYNHGLQTRLLDNHGLASRKETKHFIKQIETISPDVIHLHNIHGYYLNYSLLFDFLSQVNIPVVWTLHDCWAFTGQCSHFENEKCEKWKNGCYKCTRLNVYPNSLMDSTAFQWKVKKNLFGKMERLTIVTPSVWLKEQVKLSFLKDKRIEVINNGIDLNVFRPRKSDFRSIYGIEDKYVILGVAFDWGYRKGLDVFCYLAEHLDESFAIVLVGTSDSIDKNIPDRIVSIHRTDNIEQLVEIYTASDLFLNPTREDTFPTVNIEALACGLPVMTFSTGGSPEIINENCGSIIASNKACEVLKAINAIKINKAFKDSKCIQNARKYSKEEKFEEYLKLYEDCTHCS